MLKYIIVILKGLAMGAANVIPGVSGGTIAFITGIFERIIDAIKKIFSIKSIKLFFTGKFSEWARYTDLAFVIALGLGILMAIISFARLLEYLFEVYPVQVWAFFFGLVLASVWYVSRSVKKWNVIVALFFIFGAAVAISLAMFNPLGENRSLVYLLICGAVAACSMILPGLSGSFVLVLMGNYELVMIESVNNADFEVLIPVVIGAGAGLLLFSYFLSWIMKKFRDQTIATLSGFVLGSLLIIWPWKESVWKVDAAGEFLLSRSGDKIVEKYIWQLPKEADLQLFAAIGFIILGIALIVVTEALAGKVNRGAERKS